MQMQIPLAQPVVAQRGPPVYRPRQPMYRPPPQAPKPKVAGKKPKANAGVSSPNYALPPAQIAGRRDPLGQASVVPVGAQLNEGEASIIE